MQHLKRCGFTFFTIYTMKNQLKQIESCYKLNSKVVERMTARHVVGPDGSTYPGCSKLMIACMIHFSHICSTKGEIESIRLSSLELVLKCDKRSIYSCIDALIMRGFIKVETVDSFAGIKRITILNNDFSSVNYESGVRYLNTNYPFFNYRSNEGYDKFLNLSLYAMRLLIYILYNYNAATGYRTSYDNLCAKLSIKKRFRIQRYLKEIESVIGKDFFKTSKNEVKRYTYGSVSIPSYYTNAKAAQKYYPTQDTYYTHRLEEKMVSYGFDRITGVGLLHRFASRLGSIVNTFLQKNLSLELIENTAFRILTDHYILDQTTLTDIYKRLLYLAAPSTNI